jgi:hypothetical protein
VHFVSQAVDSVTIMNTATTPSSHELERLLTEAGIAFTIVARCPDPTCVICAPETLPAAA